MNSSSPDDTSAAAICVTGWRDGAQSVSAIQAIRSASRLGLVDAKELVERVLAGEPVVVNLNNAASIQELLSALDGFGFVANMTAR